ncbi:MAG: preprotein translocase subunit SecA [Gammaproteobacteria bacterium]|jgi:preprotein translocase subunit SecA|nr:preprotein translocase subunit SecA [Gammaproteobacteria bacterium]MBT3870658.1 preprotein translocase subunit SecA [Gammaproteobacteria bacterium]MBT4380577.1 preprotein translocase subunit SecA [Gammaproteobacteria bacterium]MBT5441499.1 preprotein translocase subunit SecA [Gammaproteobacteria bacterium]MBT5792553.1 preprotein translocase subunit SecA [Gammaproteobacteria bacterium]
MVLQVLSKVFGSKNERELKRMRKTVLRVNVLEDDIEKLSAEALIGQREKLKSRLEAGESLEDILPEAFATVREAGKRALGLRLFDVQMIGGITLHEGRIAEMRTGEGKTLVATLPLYLNAITGDGVHLVTVNDYLAKWGAEWMGSIFATLGMTVGVVYAGQSADEKQRAYQADVTYGTNNEFGFDYLRDNMAFSAEERVQRRMNFAIVDEVDSILIDEARTPLIISGGLENTADVYKAINGIVPGLVEQVKTPEDIEEDREPPGDYFVDEKQRDVELTEEGHQKIENLLVRKGLLAEGESLYGTANLTLFHHVSASLKAHKLYKRDVDYIVAEGEIVIVDEHTGRTMVGRRWSGGIHQAIEAKENVNITNESQTLASTTFQNYFRLYDKLAGMTGTADTEAFEFRQIYGLDVVVIPTNLPMVRRDLNDLIFMSHAEKFEAIADEIADCLANNAPVLVGTASIETSELLSELLNKKKVKHSVLNAKFHEKEAEIIAQAGRPGTVTIATNMAGRGTDIILGGSWEAEVAHLEAPTPEQVEKIKVAWQKSHDQVLEAGGLHVIGTERHESRRIDNQLRGRAGRQGDPGYSRFYLSLEDDLMRIFASDRVRGFMQNMGMENGEAIEHKMVTNAIEKAQRKVEGRNFDIRKQLLEYDDVANDQRQMIYGQRNELIESEEISHIVDALWDDVIDEVIDGYIPPQSLEEQWDVPGLESACHTEFNVKLPVQNWLDEDSSLFEDTLRQRIVAEIRAEYVKKEALIGPQLRMFEKRIMLDILDGLWKEHLAAMDYLRQGIHLRAYAQKKPKDEYKREAFDLFDNLLRSVRFDVIRFLSRVQFQSEEDAEALELRRREEESRVQKNYQKDGSPGMDGAAVKTPADELNEPFVRPDKKVGRNEPCPCGSGKKYKACHGKLG